MLNIKEDHFQGIYRSFLKSVTEISRERILDREKNGCKNSDDLIDDVLDRHILSCINAMLNFKESGRNITICEFYNYSKFINYGYNFFDYAVGKDYRAKQVKAERKYMECRKDPMASPYKALHYKNKIRDYEELNMKCKTIGEVLITLSNYDFYIKDREI